MPKKILAWGLFLILSFIWGSSFILIKKGLEGIKPVELGTIRILSGALFLLPLSIKNLFKIKLTKQNFFYIFLVGLLGSLFPALLFSWAQMSLSSSVSGALNGLTPIFTVLVGIIFFSENHPRIKYFGIFFSFIGLIFLSMSKESTAINFFSKFNLSALLVVLATFFYGTNINIIKYKLDGINPSIASSVSLLFSGFLALIYLMFFSDFFTVDIYREESQKALMYIITLGCLSTGLALVLFMNLIKLSSPLFASSVTYMMPVFAIFWGILDGESLFFNHYLGLCLIGLGIYFINFIRR